MSKYVVCAIYDSKVNAFEDPFHMRSRGEAIRSWQYLVNKSDTKFAAHPEDFALMELGTYDSETGRFENHNVPVNLGLAVQYLKPVVPAPLANGHISREMSEMQLGS